VILTRRYSISVVCAMVYGAFRNLDKRKRASETLQYPFGETRGAAASGRPTDFSYGQAATASAAGASNDLQLHGISSSSL